MKKIGLIGVGMMGHGIASNIVKHGYPLAVLEHPGNQPLDALIAAGATTNFEKGIFFIVRIFGQQ